MKFFTVACVPKDIWIVSLTMEPFSRKIDHEYFSLQWKSSLHKFIWFDVNGSAFFDLKCKDRMCFFKTLQARKMLFYCKAHRARYLDATKQIRARLSQVQCSLENLAVNLAVFICTSNKHDVSPWTIKDYRKNCLNICFILIHAHKAA